MNFLSKKPLSLKFKLTGSLAGVIAIILSAVGIVSIATLQSSVIGIVDRQLDDSMSGFTHSVKRNRVDSNQGQFDRFLDKRLTEFGGQAPGTVIILFANGKIADSAVFSDGEPASLELSSVHGIESGAWVDGKRQNFDDPKLGEMRMETKVYDEHLTLVAGVSLSAAKEAVKRASFIVLFLSVAALVTTVAVTLAVVRYALRSLSRVVATAKKVTLIPLDSGDVGLGIRVAAPDTDMRTEVGQVGEALNHLLNHIDSALTVRAVTERRMKQFVTDASHELRTPLAAIRGYAELTRQDSSLLPETSEYALSRIESESKRMSSLVADLLLLARLDEGQDLDINRVDLNGLLINAVSDARASMIAHHWFVNVPDRPVVIDGDAKRLHQVVANILANAGTHTLPGSTVVTQLSIETDAQHLSYVEITISDDGPGIPADMVHTIFQRFVRGDKARARNAGNSGLGLAIVSSIVEAHEGSTSVESSAFGSIFRIRIPIRTK